MLVTDIGPIPFGALPIDPFKAHLRLPEGFEEISGQALRLEVALRAALATLEARLGRVFITRARLMALEAHEVSGKIALPFDPVTHLVAARKVDHLGTVTPLSVEDWQIRLAADPPCLLPGPLPALEARDQLEIELQAGRASSYEDLPPDILTAWLLEAALLFEQKTDFEIARMIGELILPYRKLRVGLRR